ncbi:flagellar protein FlgN [Neobacillus sp. OS1-2]|uniref:flagellar protein FlgN n=1 Tax=Neobacillus sp. OS1-2 TaxID=3070680 RepID=UPI0027E0C8F5|nr:flagellar protein FlgN [Neobacillus sp. OS1-2]WML39377.1 flagellar protein FlgN [Neobacillus sp. OS1-2]
MNSMDKLIQTLEAMAATHTQLLDLVKEKRDLLVGGSIQGLTGLIQLENKCADKIQKLELERQEQVQLYLLQKGISGQSNTLEQLINIQDDAESKFKLQSIAKKLRGLVEAISQVNESNKQLIQASLSYIHYSIGMLIPNEPAIGYGPNAAKRTTSFLDAKI